jgi:NADPH:quinone reductase-like Zn-dependent oxidoreductase
MMGTIKAAVRERYGPPDVVQIRDVAAPVPEGDEVLVRVHAASVNRADLDALYARWAFLRLFLGLRRPRNHRLGIDAAGVVESVGSDVTRFQPGDRVFGDLFPFGQDAYSELVCAPDGAFATIPAEMSFDEAATIPHAAVLAMSGLRRRDGRGFAPGARVLVVGASGSVGPFAVQVAKARGAHVTGVASTDKLAFVRSLGADEVIDYSAVDYTRPALRYDWIVDVNAHHSVLAWRHAVRSGGVYAALGGDSAAWFVQALVQGPALSLATHRGMGLVLHWKPFHRPDVDELLAMVAAGQVRPAIDRRYPLSELAEALRYVDEGHARGKVVITM